MKLAAALALVRRYRLLRCDIEGIVNILIVLMFVLFGVGVVFQMVANRTGAALRLCRAAALALVA